MKVCVIGAGIVGVTTAWLLSERGHDVIVVDGQDGPGLGTSYANGAQLSYSYVAPFASPETLRKLPELILARDAPTRLRLLQFDPSFYRWSLAFLRASTSSMVARTTRAQLALAALSRLELERIAKAGGLSFGLETNGKLVIFRKEASFAGARAQVELQKGMGAEQRVLSPRECFENEPALRLREQDLAGGIFTPSEQVGDCHAFCVAAGDTLRRRNSVEWRMNEQVLAPVIRGGRLVAIRTAKGEIEADLFVLTMGMGSTRFARAAGFRLPIYPLKGYSITARPRAPQDMLTRSVTDSDQKVVFAPLQRDGQDAIRVAGIADLVGESLAIDEGRLESVRRLARTVFSLEAGGDDAPWAGLRPATPDSRPIIGPSPVPGLFLNTGHGALGWTLACGSARLAADLIMDMPPPLEAGWFSLRRNA